VGKLVTSPPTSGARQGAYSTQHSTGSPGKRNQPIQQKCIQIRKDVKLSLFADNKILCEKALTLHQKPLELTHEFRKVGCKINIRK
jgi:hypothetical protein